MNRTFLQDLNIQDAYEPKLSPNQTHFINSRESYTTENKDFGINYAEYGYNIGTTDNFMHIINDESSQT
jgi:hypothetical protein